MRELTAGLNLCKASVFEKAAKRMKQLSVHSSQFTVKPQNLKGDEEHNNELITANCQLHCAPQPLFHKNFDLLRQTISDYALKGYTVYICSDSDKQLERLREILDSSQFAVHSSQFAVHSSQFKSKTSKDEGNHNCELRTENYKLIKGTLHEGFIDEVMKIVLLTDHQIFERFHKYQLKGQNAKRGKMELTMK